VIYVARPAHESRYEVAGAANACRFAINAFGKAAATEYRHLLARARACARANQPASQPASQPVGGSINQNARRT